MTSNTKVMLSAKELELVTNPEIILTKNAVIGKVYELFGQLSEAYKTILKDEALLAIGPKIARGENYQGLPWVMLDFPRRFSHDDTFAIRTFFWWGNFFSITLQLSGKSKAMYLPQLLNALQQPDFNNWYIGVNEDEWQHDFEPDNYVAINNIDWKAELGKQPVTKLATKIPLQEWDDIFLILLNNFKLIGSIIQ